MPKKYLGLKLYSSSPSRKSIKGFIDPLSLFGAIFLIISLFIGVYAVSKSDVGFDIRKLARVPKEADIDSEYDPVITPTSKPTPVPTPTEPYCTSFMNSDCAFGCQPTLDGGRCKSSLSEPTEGVVPTVPKEETPKKEDITYTDPESIGCGPCNCSGISRCPYGGTVSCIPPSSCNEPPKKVSDLYDTPVLTGEEKIDDGESQVERWLQTEEEIEDTITPGICIGICTCDGKKSCLFGGVENCDPPSICNLVPKKEDLKYPLEDEQIQEAGIGSAIGSFFEDVIDGAKKWISGEDGDDSQVDTWLETDDEIDTLTQTSEPYCSGSNSRKCLWGCSPDIYGGECKSNPNPQKRPPTILYVEPELGLTDLQLELLEGEEIEKIAKEEEETFELESLKKGTNWCSGNYKPGDVVIWGGYVQGCKGGSGGKDGEWVNLTAEGYGPEALTVVPDWLTPDSKTWQRLAGLTSIVPTYEVDENGNVIEPVKERGCNTDSGGVPSGSVSLGGVGVRSRCSDGEWIACSDDPNDVSNYCGLTIVPSYIKNNQELLSELESELALYNENISKYFDKYQNSYGQCSSDNVADCIKEASEALVKDGLSKDLAQQIQEEFVSQLATNYVYPDALDKYQQCLAVSGKEGCLDEMANLNKTVANASINDIQLTQINNRYIAEEYNAIFNEYSELRYKVIDCSETAGGRLSNFSSGCRDILNQLTKIETSPLFKYLEAKDNFVDCNSFEECKYWEEQITLIEEDPVFGGIENLQYIADNYRSPSSMFEIIDTQNIVTQKVFNAVLSNDDTALRDACLLSTFYPWECEGSQLEEFKESTWENILELQPDLALVLENMEKTQALAEENIQEQLSVTPLSTCGQYNIPYSYNSCSKGYSCFSGYCVPEEGTEVSDLVLSELEEQQLLQEIAQKQNQCNQALPGSLYDRAKNLCVDGGVNNIPGIVPLGREVLGKYQCTSSEYYSDGNCYLKTNDAYDLALGAEGVGLFIERYNKKLDDCRDEVISNGGIACEDESLIFSKTSNYLYGTYIPAGKSSPILKLSSEVNANDRFNWYGEDTALLLDIAMIEAIRDIKGVGQLSNYYLPGQGVVDKQKLEGEGILDEVEEKAWIYLKANVRNNSGTFLGLNFSGYASVEDINNNVSYLERHCLENGLNFAELISLNHNSSYEVGENNNLISTGVKFKETTGTFFERLGATAINTSRVNQTPSRITNDWLDNKTNPDNPMYIYNSIYGDGANSIKSSFASQGIYLDFSQSYVDWTDESGLNQELFKLASQGVADYSQTIKDNVGYRLAAVGETVGAVVIGFVANTVKPATPIGFAVGTAIEVGGDLALHGLVDGFTYTVKERFADAVKQSEEVANYSEGQALIAQVDSNLRKAKTNEYITIVVFDFVANLAGEALSKSLARKQLTKIADPAVLFAKGSELDEQIVKGFANDLWDGSRIIVRDNAGELLEITSKTEALDALNNKLTVRIADQTIQNSASEVVSNARGFTQKKFFQNISEFLTPAEKQVFEGISQIDEILSSSDKSIARTWIDNYQAKREAADFVVGSDVAQTLQASSGTTYKLANGDTLDLTKLIDGEQSIRIAQPDGLVSWAGKADDFARAIDSGSFAFKNGDLVEVSSGAFIEVKEDIISKFALSNFTEVESVLANNYVRTSMGIVPFVNSIDEVNDIVLKPKTLIEIVENGKISKGVINDFGKITKLDGFASFASGIQTGTRLAAGVDINTGKFSMGDWILNGVLAKDTPLGKLATQIDALRFGGNIVDEGEGILLSTTKRVQIRIGDKIVDLPNRGYIRVFDGNGKVLRYIEIDDSAILPKEYLKKGYWLQISENTYTKKLTEVGKKVSSFRNLAIEIDSPVVRAKRNIAVRDFVAEIFERGEKKAVVSEFKIVQENLSAKKLTYNYNYVDNADGTRGVNKVVFDFGDDIDPIHKAILEKRSKQIEKAVDDVLIKYDPIMRSSGKMNPLGSVELSNGKILTKRVGENASDFAYRIAKERLDDPGKFINAKVFNESGDIDNFFNWRLSGDETIQPDVILDSVLLPGTKIVGAPTNLGKSVVAIENIAFLKKQLLGPDTKITIILKNSQDLAEFRSVFDDKAANFLGFKSYVMDKVPPVRGDLSTIQSADVFIGTSDTIFNSLDDVGMGKDLINELKGSILIGDEAHISLRTDVDYIKSVGGNLVIDTPRATRFQELFDPDDGILRKLTKQHLDELSSNSKITQIVDIEDNGTIVGKGFTKEIREDSYWKIVNSRLNEFPDVEELRVILGTYDIEDALGKFIHSSPTDPQVGLVRSLLAEDVSSFKSAQKVFSEIPGNDFGQGTRIFIDADGNTEEILAVVPFERNVSTGRQYSLVDDELAYQYLGRKFLGFDDVKNINDLKLFVTPDAIETNYGRFLKETFNLDESLVLTATPRKIQNQWLTRYGISTSLYGSSQQAIPERGLKILENNFSSLKNVGDINSSPLIKEQIDGVPDVYVIGANRTSNKEIVERLRKIAVDNSRDIVVIKGDGDFVLYKVSGEIQDISDGLKGIQELANTYKSQGKSLNIIYELGRNYGTDLKTLSESRFITFFDNSSDVTDFVQTIGRNRCDSGCGDMFAMFIGDQDINGASFKSLIEQNEIINLQKIAVSDIDGEIKNAGYRFIQRLQELDDQKSIGNIFRKDIDFDDLNKKWRATSDLDTTVKLTGLTPEEYIAQQTNRFQRFINELYDDVSFRNSLSRKAREFLTESYGDLIKADDISFLVEGALKIDTLLPLSNSLNAKQLVDNIGTTFYKSELPEAIAGKHLSSSQVKVLADVQQKAQEIVVKSDISEIATRLGGENLRQVVVDLEKAGRTMINAVGELADIPRNLTNNLLNIGKQALSLTADAFKKVEDLFVKKEDQQKLITTTQEKETIQKEKTADIQELYERGKIIEIIAHGVEEEKGGLDNLASIMVEGIKGEYDVFTGFLIEGDPTYTSGPHGPYYVILATHGEEPPKSVALEGQENIRVIDTSTHKAYVVPDLSSKDILSKLLDSLITDGKIDLSQKEALLVKTYTYAEYLSLDEVQPTKDEIQKYRQKEQSAKENRIEREKYAREFDSKNNVQYIDSVESSCFLTSRGIEFGSVNADKKLYLRFNYEMGGSEDSHIKLIDIYRRNDITIKVNGEGKQLVGEIAIKEGEQVEFDGFSFRYEGIDDTQSFVRAKLQILGISESPEVSKSISQKRPSFLIDIAVSFFEGLQKGISNMIDKVAGLAKPETGKKIRNAISQITEEVKRFLKDRKVKVDTSFVHKALQRFNNFQSKETGIFKTINAKPFKLRWAISRFFLYPVLIPYDLTRLGVNQAIQRLNVEVGRPEDVIQDIPDVVKVEQEEQEKFKLKEWWNSGKTQEGYKKVVLGVYSFTQKKSGIIFKNLNSTPKQLRWWITRLTLPQLLVPYDLTRLGVNEVIKRLNIELEEDVAEIVEDITEPDVEILEEELDIVYVPEEELLLLPAPSQITVPENSFIKEQQEKLNTALDAIERQAEERRSLEARIKKILENIKINSRYKNILNTIPPIEYLWTFNTLRQNIYLLNPPSEKYIKALEESEKLLKEANKELESIRLKQYEDYLESRDALEKAQVENKELQTYLDAVEKIAEARRKLEDFIKENPVLYQTIYNVPKLLTASDKYYNLVEKANREVIEKAEKAKRDAVDEYGDLLRQLKKLSTDVIEAPFSFPKDVASVTTEALQSLNAQIKKLITETQRIRKERKILEKIEEESSRELALNWRNLWLGEYEYFVKNNERQIKKVLEQYDYPSENIDKASKRVAFKTFEYVKKEISDHLKNQKHFTLEEGVKLDQSIVKFKDLGIEEINVSQILDAPSIDNWASVKRSAGKDTFGKYRWGRFFEFIQSMRDGRFNFTRPNFEIRLKHLGGGVYVVLDGSHRIAAAKAAGIKTVKAIVLEPEDVKVLQEPWYYVVNLEKYGVVSKARELINEAREYTSTLPEFDTKKYQEYVETLKDVEYKNQVLLQLNTAIRPVRESVSNLITKQLNIALSKEKNLDKYKTEEELRLAIAGYVKSYMLYLVDEGYIKNEAKKELLKLEIFNKYDEDGQIINQYSEVIKDTIVNSTDRFIASQLSPYYLSIKSIVDQNTKTNVVAVGDVHGDWNSLVHLLSGQIRSQKGQIISKSLLDNRGKWIGNKNSQLVLTGDLFDRAPKGILSSNTAKAVMNLQKSAGYLSNGEPRVVVLLGNHDVNSILALWRMKQEVENGRSIKDAAGLAVSFSRMRPSIAVEDLINLYQNPELVEWVTNLPAMYFKDGKIFMHSDSYRYLEFGRSIDEVNKNIQKLVKNPNTQSKIQVIGVDGKQRIKNLEGLVSNMTERRQLDSNIVNIYNKHFGGEIETITIIHGHSQGERPIDSRVINVDGGLSEGYARLGPNRARFYEFETQGESKLVIQKKKEKPKTPRIQIEIDNFEVIDSQTANKIIDAKSVEKSSFAKRINQAGKAIWRTIFISSFIGIMSLILFGTNMIGLPKYEVPVREIAPIVEVLEGEDFYAENDNLFIPRGKVIEESVAEDLGEKELLTTPELYLQIKQSNIDDMRNIKYGQSGYVNTNLEVGSGLNPYYKHTNHRDYYEAISNSKIKYSSREECVSFLQRISPVGGTPEEVGYVIKYGSEYDPRVLDIDFVSVSGTSLEAPDSALPDKEILLPKEVVNQINEANIQIDEMGLGVQIRIVSGFRSYEQQQEFNYKAANETSAAGPGYSQHQSGYALDITLVDSQGKNLGFSAAKNKDVLKILNSLGIVHPRPDDSQHLFALDANTGISGYTQNLIDMGIDINKYEPTVRSLLIAEQFYEYILTNDIDRYIVDAQYRQIANSQNTSSVLINGGIFPFFNAQFFEALANKYIYSRWPEAREEGTLPILIKEIKKWIRNRKEEKIVPMTGLGQEEQLSALDKEIERDKEREIKAKQLLEQIGLNLNLTLLEDQKFVISRVFDVGHSLQLPALEFSRKLKNQDKLSNLTEFAKSQQVLSSWMYKYLVVDGYKVVVRIDASKLFNANMVPSEIPNLNGDYLLRVIIGTIQKILGTDYIIVRSGGDEYVIMVSKDVQIAPDKVRQLILSSLKDFQMFFDLDGKTQLQPVEVNFPEITPIEEIFGQLPAKNISPVALINDIKYDPLLSSEKIKVFRDKESFVESLEGSRNLIKVDVPGVLKWLNDNQSKKAGNEFIKSLFNEVTKVIEANLKLSDIGVYKRGGELYLALPSTLSEAEIFDIVGGIREISASLGQKYNIPVIVGASVEFIDDFNVDAVNQALDKLGPNVSTNQVEGIASLLLEEPLGGTAWNFFFEYFNPHDKRGIIRLTNLGLTARRIKTIKGYYKQVGQIWKIDKLEAMQKALNKALKPFLPKEELIIPVTGETLDTYNIDNLVNEKGLLERIEEDRQLREKYYQNEKESLTRKQRRKVKTENITLLGKVIANKILSKFPKLERIIDKPSGEDIARFCLNYEWDLDARERELGRVKKLTSYYKVFLQEHGMLHINIEAYKDLSSKEKETLAVLKAGLGDDMEDISDRDLLIATAGIFRSLREVQRVFGSLDNYKEFIELSISSLNYLILNKTGWENAVAYKTVLPFSFLSFISGNFTGKIYRGFYNPDLQFPFMTVDRSNNLVKLAHVINHEIIHSNQLIYDYDLLVNKPIYGELITDSLAIESIYGINNFPKRAKTRYFNAQKIAQARELLIKSGVGEGVVWQSYVASALRGIFDGEITINFYPGGEVYRIVGLRELFNERFGKGEFNRFVSDDKYNGFYGSDRWFEDRSSFNFKMRIDNFVQELNTIFDIFSEKEDYGEKLLQKISQSTVNNSKIINILVGENKTLWNRDKIQFFNGPVGKRYTTPFAWVNSGFDSQQVHQCCYHLPSIYVL